MTTKTKTTKQLIFISDKKESESLLPLPKFGNLGEEPSRSDIDAYARWKKDVETQKAWAKRYPAFHEHYEQMKFSSEEANNEAWWLQQQDNSIRYDRPSEESQESFYLEELFGDNAYSNTDNQEKRSDSKLSEKFDTGNKFDKWSFTSGKRHYSTLSKRYYSTSGRDLPSNSKILTEFLLEKNLKPVYVYENLSEDSTKKKILEETRGLSGIYLILNKVTKDYYIGSASNNKIYTRFARHLINLSGSKVVKNAVKKYKISEFAFLVLEIFPEIVTQENNQKFMKRFNLSWKKVDAVCH